MQPREHITPEDTIKISRQLDTYLRGVWHDRLSPGGVLITWLASKNFGVIRFPTRPDRSVDGKGSRHSEAVQLLDSLTPEELERLAQELSQVTERTQTWLRKHYPGGYIPLQRAISPLSDDPTDEKNGHNREVDDVAMFPRLAEAAKLAGMSEITLDVDIVSGWSVTSTQRYGTLHLKREWPIDNILLFSELLRSESGGPGVLENDEWLCINTSPSGLMTFAIADIVVASLPAYYHPQSGNQQAVLRLAQQLQQQASGQSAARGIAARPDFFQGKRDPLSLWQLLTGWWKGDRRWW